MLSDCCLSGLHCVERRSQAIGVWDFSFDMNNCSYNRIGMARKTGSHAETTRPLIREAALRLFAQNGYAAVSMRKIASEVGLQAGALYLYTPDKQTLLYELMEEHLTDLIEAWNKVEAGRDPTNRLEAFARFHIAFNIERPESVFIAYMELRNLNPENFAKITALRGRYEAILTEILADGQRAGLFDVTDTKLSAMAIIAMLTGVNTWFKSEGRLSREQVETVYWDMVRKSVMISGK